MIPLHGLKIQWLTRGSQCVVLDGETSNPVPVLPGVPQHKVLRPLMFLLCINGITEDINSPLCTFADDCLLYRIIESTENTVHKVYRTEILMHCNTGNS